MRRTAEILVTVFLLAACSGGAVDPVDETIPPGVGETTAVASVEALVDAVEAGDFADASRLAVPGQAALASLAEGASFADVAAGLRDGDEEIAANFWAGFAQGAGSYLVGPLDAADSGTIDESGVEFALVSVTPSEGDSRQLYLRDEDGYRIDIFASFGTGLADKMIAPAERLLTSQTEDARLVLKALEGIVPSLLVAARQEGVPNDVSQEILTLVEVITRVG